MVAGLQDTRTVVGVKAKGLFTSTCINNGGIRGSECYGTHGERSVLIADRRAGRPGIRGTPDTAHCAADEYGIARSIGRVHGDGHDPSSHWGKESSSRRSGTD